MRFLKRHGPGRSCALTLALCLTWLGSDAQAGWYPGKLIKKWWSGGKCESCESSHGQPIPELAQGEEPPPWGHWRLRKRWPGRAFVGTGGGEHTFHRSGYANEQSKYARPSYDGRYVGYYVGGGSAFGGQGPTCPNAPSPRLVEGTFGWDYAGGKWLPHRVVLKWWNKFQGGVGRYETDDGPQVTDIGPYLAEIPKGPVRKKESEEGH